MKGVKRQRKSQTSRAWISGAAILGQQNATCYAIYYNFHEAMKAGRIADNDFLWLSV